MLLLYFRRYPITFLLALAIVLLSLLPIPDVRMKVEVPLMDKWTHMVMYGVLTLVIWLEYIRAHRQMRGLRLLLLAFLAPIAMGGALELMQAYLTTCRSGEWLDFVANSIGAVVGAGCGLLASRLGDRSSAQPKTGV
ncbi:MAG: VanZ family protein [Bacteroidaceae bacterium]|nr:VanZ family protein [Bacteroidaceae bacterium]